MKRICIILSLILAINLSSKAPTLDKEFLETRFNNNVKEILLQDRINLILKTIRIIESRENYQLKGKSKEYGAYQFTKATWKYYSYVFFKKYLDIKIPENQDLVARAKVDMLVRNGFTNEEIASFWNSGSKKWKGKIGTNKYGVKYNVPNYVNKFIKTKNLLKWYEI